MSNYMLDSQTKSGMRLTAFSDSIIDLSGDLEEWLTLGNYTQEDLWYADLFEGLKHIGVLHFTNDGKVVIEPAPPNSKMKPFKRNRFIAKLKGKLK